MKTLLKTIKPYLIWLIPIFGILYIIHLIFKNFKNGKPFIPVTTLGSLSEIESRNYADSLHVAMGSMGTDFEVIVSVLSKLNSSTYKQVYNSFNKRGYLDVLGVGIDVLYPKMLNLTQWLNSELSTSQRAVIVRDYPFVFAE